MEYIASLINLYFVIIFKDIFFLMRNKNLRSTSSKTILNIYNCILWLLYTSLISLKSVNTEKKVFGAGQGYQFSKNNGRQRLLYLK